MKKIVYMAASLLLCLTVFSCSKEDVGGTATESMAGDWYVTCDAVDENGQVVIEDFNEGLFHILTYNTVENVPTKLYVDDEENMLGLKVVATSDMNAMTFSTPDTLDVECGYLARYVNGRAIVTDGKIVKNGGHQKNGSVADSISFYVEYSQDALAEDNGYKKYHFHGVRYSGLVEND
jgi:hypothetical protein